MPAEIEAIPFTRVRFDPARPADPPISSGVAGTSASRHFWLAARVASFGLLSVSMKSLPLGTAYTVWTGIGAVGAFVVGVIWLNEGVHPMRVAAAGLIVAGLVVMRLAPAN